MVWHHNDYSEEALAEMQREAEERVREMQARARLLVGKGTQNTGQKTQSRPREERPPQQSGRQFSEQQNSRNQDAQFRSLPPGDAQSFQPRNAQPRQQQSPAPMQTNFQSANPFGELSKFIGSVGEDKLIVLAILWLLWNEHADNKLLLALLYILL